MPKYQDECIQILQNAINLLDASQKWENQAHVRAQKLGLQGEKRRERSEERKDLCLMQHLQSVALDLFDVELIPESTSVVFPTIGRIPDYFTAYLAKLWETYDALHMAANELVMKGYKCIASPIYCHVACLFGEIIETRRTIKEGNLAGWEYHHVSRYQVSYDNVHDRYEEKEHKQGYEY